MSTRKIKPIIHKEREENRVKEGKREINKEEAREIKFY